MTLLAELLRHRPAVGSDFMWHRSASTQIFAAGGDPLSGPVRAIPTSASSTGGVSAARSVGSQPPTKRRSRSRNGVLNSDGAGQLRPGFPRTELCAENMDAVFHRGGATSSIGQCASAPVSRWSSAAVAASRDRLGWWSITFVAAVPCSSMPWPRWRRRESQQRIWRSLCSFNPRLAPQNEPSRDLFALSRAVPARPTVCTPAVGESYSNRHHGRNRALTSGSRVAPRRRGIRRSAVSVPATRSREEADDGGPSRTSACAVARLGGARRSNSRSANLPRWPWLSVHRRGTAITLRDSDMRSPTLVRLGLVGRQRSIKGNPRRPASRLSARVSVTSNGLDCTTGHGRAPCETRRRVFARVQSSARRLVS